MGLWVPGPGVGLERSGRRTQPLRGRGSSAGLASLPQVDGASRAHDKYQQRGGHPLALLVQSLRVKNGGTPAWLLWSSPGRQELSWWAGHIPRRMAREEGGDDPIISPAMERLSCAPSLEFHLHWQFHLSVLILGQEAALWLRHGRIYSLRHLTAPPPPTVEQ